jgi:hypothetical protein
MFAQRLAWHSIARVTRALYDAGIPCPSAADPSGTRTALSGVDAGNGGGDPGETTVYRPEGVEPAAHRLRPGRRGCRTGAAPARSRTVRRKESGTRSRSLAEWRKQGSAW